jgi:hypothetical protein
MMIIRGGGMELSQMVEPKVFHLPAYVACMCVCVRVGDWGWRRPRCCSKLAKHRTTMGRIGCGNFTCRLIIM